MPSGMFIGEGVGSNARHIGLRRLATPWRPRGVESRLKIAKVAWSWRFPEHGYVQNRASLAGAPRSIFELEGKRGIVKQTG
jgi:hypothetical protein